MSAAIEIADVSKVYDGGVRAVDAVAMAIKPAARNTPKPMWTR